MPEAPLLALAPEAAVIALAAALLAWAATALFRPVFRSIAAGIPVISRAADAWALRTVLGLSVSVQGWIDSAVSPLAAVVLSPWQKLDHVFTEVEATFAAVASRLASMPAAILAAAHQVIYLPLATDIDQLTHWTRAQVAALAGSIDQAVATAEAYTAREANAARAGAERTAADALDALRQELAPEIAAATATANTALNDVHYLAGYAESLANIAEAQRATIGTVISSTIPTAIAGVKTAGEQYADGLVNHLGGVVDARFALVEAAAAKTAAVAASAESYVENCGKELCDGLQSTAQQLGQVAGVLDGAGILAWIISAAADPQGFAQTTQSMLGPSLSGLQGALQAVLPGQR